MYSRDTLTFNEVYDALYSKEKMKHLVVGFEALIKGLVVHERKMVGHGRSKIKNKNNDKICWYSNNKGHMKNDCYKLWNMNNFSTTIRRDNQEILVISTLQKKTIVMKIFWGFLMGTPNLTRIRFFIRLAHFIYVLSYKGFVVIENNEPCKIAGIDKVRIKMFDGMVRTIGLVRHVP